MYRISISVGWKEKVLFILAIAMWLKKENAVRIGLKIFKYKSAHNDTLFLLLGLTYFEVSAGFLFNNENSFFGLSLKHLNKPNISFMIRGNEPLDMFLSASGGYEMSAAEVFGNLFHWDAKLLFTGNFMKQAEYSRFDLGGTVVLSKAVFGITAATNPLRIKSNSHFITSLNIHGGLQYDHFVFGYSYDVDTRKMGRTGGAHEFSVVYQFDLERRCFGLPK